MPSVLPYAFFSRNTIKVAEELLGKYLCMKTGADIERYMITETEAYDGPEDKACHGSKGRTKRTEIMFGPAGHFYIYFIYGMYWMLNITTADEGYPAAVLIRGVEGFDGPGKLTRDVGIDKRFHGMPLSKKTGLWVEDHGVVIDPKMIKKTPRIGVDYAGACAKKPWRFVLCT